MAEPFVLWLGRRYFAGAERSRLASFLSALAVLGLVAGVALLILVLAVMNGFERALRERILVLVPHLELSQAGGLEGWQGVRRELERMAGVEEAHPFTRVYGLLVRGTRATAVEVLGLDHDDVEPVLAAALGPTFARLGADEVLVSKLLARRLGLEPGARVALIVPRGSAGGRELPPAVASFAVAGLFETHTAEDQALVVAPLAAAGRLAGLDAAPQGLRVRLAEPFAARHLSRQLAAILPADLRVGDWFESHGNLFEAIRLSRELVGLLVFLVVAIAAFNVAAMMVMGVADKRPAIAILKTLGATPGEVVAVFLVQGALIGFFGSLLGVALGAPLAWAAPRLAAWLQETLGVQFLSAEIYPIDYLPSDLRWGDVLAVAGAGFALTLLATLYPAWRAARVRPARELRYE
ncbi:MAG: hypothetical protein KatS3mg124_0079 [Porticoccaceae bacterium]|nr:MAG: hypothetical protein KatS3mg124_0079 [Porticoccaceae bacterium]